MLASKQAPSVHTTHGIESSIKSPSVRPSVSSRLGSQRPMCPSRWKSSVSTAMLVFATSNVNSKHVNAASAVLSSQYTEKINH